MIPYRKPILYYLCLLICLMILSALLLHGAQTIAQTISTPIPRHTVLHNTSRYCSFTWTPSANNVNPRVWTYFVPCTGQWETHIMTSAFTAGSPVVGMAYKWGGGDYIDDYPAAGANDYFLRRLSNGNLAGDINNNWTICPNREGYKPTYNDAAGVDCSGLVTRAWGRPTNEKMGYREYRRSGSLDSCSLQGYRSPVYADRCQE